MEKYITLIGTEQMQSAANTMRSAAESMRQTAANMDESMRTFYRMMDDWLQRFEAANNVYLEALEQQRQAHSQFGVGA